LKEDPEARAEEFVTLEQKAAEQFIQTGHFQEGTEMIRAVLAEFGIELPSSRERALQKAALLRLTTLVRGLRPNQRAKEPDEIELRRFDALWAANTRLSMFDYALCTYATARCTLDALKLGEPSRLSRALSMEASYSSLLPQPFFQKRATRLLEMAEGFAAAGESSEYDRIFALGARSIISFYQGEFRRTWQLADAAIQRLREYSPGRTWEEGPWQMWSLLGLSLNGELRELTRRVRSARDDATLRDDRHIECNISLGAPSVCWLVLDQVSEAQLWADRALGWAPSDYTAQHYQHYVTSVDYDLYRNEAEAAWERTLRTWESHKRERFLSLTYIRGDLLRSRARSALAAADSLVRSGRSRTASGHDPERLRRIAADAARSLIKHRLRSAEGFAALVEAALARAAKQEGRAATRLRDAIVSFDRGGMQLFREVARFCLGTCRGEPDAGEALEQATRWLREQGVVKPDRLVAALAPGFD
jgi:hypothetical protein